MNTLSRVLSDLTFSYVRESLSENRDCRLIFPGLTESLAKELQQDLRIRLSVSVNPGDTIVPVYLVLDFPDSELEPDIENGWLRFEALTSVRLGSFIAICMPKVLPKLQDSIYGSGSPIRGLSFADDWPWNDVGIENFKFDGPVLDAVLDSWGVLGEARLWIRSLVLDGLLPTTATLADETRLSILLEDILGAFAMNLYPELDSAIEKFCYHCGIPQPESTNDVNPQKYIDSVVETANALVMQRANNPMFRDHLVNEVAPTRFNDREPDSFSRLTTSIDLMLDGALSLGTESGVLAYRGGIGNGSQSPSIEAWTSLNLETLMVLFGTRESGSVQCKVSIQEGDGVVSNDGIHAVVFQGNPISLHVTANIATARFQPDEYNLRCKRRQHEIFYRECDDSEFERVIEISPNELPASRNRLSLVVQLLRSGQVESESRVYIHICGSERPAISVFEPGFETVDLMPLEEYDEQSDSVKLTRREPIAIQVLDSRATKPCSITIENEAVNLNTNTRTQGSITHVTYSVQQYIDVDTYTGARADIEILSSDFVRNITIEGADIKPGEFTLEDELRVATISSSPSRLRRVLPLFFWGK